MARGSSKSVSVTSRSTFTLDGVVTRAKNKTKKPGLVDDINEDGRSKVRRRNSEQMKEARLQQEADTRTNEEETVNAIKNAAQIEDRLRSEDQEREGHPNHRLEATPAFQPPHPHGKGTGHLFMVSSFVTHST